MSQLSGGSAGSRLSAAVLVKANRVNKLIDNTAGVAAIVITRASVATALGLIAGQRIIQFIPTATSDDGVVPSTWKVNPASDNLPIFPPTGQFITEGKEQPDGTVEEVDDFTFTIAIGASAYYMSAYLTSGSIAD